MIDVRVQATHAGDDRDRVCRELRSQIFIGIVAVRVTPAKIRLNKVENRPDNYYDNISDSELQLLDL